MDIVINKFLFDYRITKHCTTNQSPMKLMLGREAKSRFSLMKPPIVTDVIKQKQQSAIKNFKGKRNKNLRVGQKVYIRNYEDPNKDGWSPAIVKKKIGPRNYTCLFTQTNRVIKRHLNQIRDVQLEEGADTEENDSIEGDNGSSDHSTDDDRASVSIEEEINHRDRSIGELESDLDVSNLVSSPIIISDTSLDSSQAYLDAEASGSTNESIADVIERPKGRDCANQAKEKIASHFDSYRRPKPPT